MGASQGQDGRFGDEGRDGLEGDIRRNWPVGEGSTYPRAAAYDVLLQGNRWSEAIEEDELVLHTVHRRHG